MSVCRIHGLLRSCPLFCLLKFGAHSKFGARALFEAYAKFGLLRSSSCVLNSCSGFSSPQAGSRFISRTGHSFFFPPESGHQEYQGNRWWRPTLAFLLAIIVSQPSRMLLPGFEPEVLQLRDHVPNQLTSWAGELKY